MVYLPTFTIKNNPYDRCIYHTWIRHGKLLKQSTFTVQGSSGADGDGGTVVGTGTVSETVETKI